MHVFSPQTQKDLTVAEASLRTTVKAVPGREITRVMEGYGEERGEHGGAGASGRCKRTVSELQVHRGEVGKRRSENVKCALAENYLTPPRSLGSNSVFPAGVRNSRLDALNISLWEGNWD